MGQWYDVAHKPFKYQAPCQEQSTASYRLLADEKSVQVVNRCGTSVATGIATPRDGDKMRLNVTFGKQTPPGEYWIVMVDSAHYKWAVVSNRDRSLLWVLSRKAHLPTKLLQKVLAILVQRGYDIGDLQLASSRLWQTRDIETLTMQNREFRQVLATGPHLQLVLMSLEPGGEIGAEVHPHTDQFFRLESGDAQLLHKYHAADPWTETSLQKNAAILVPAGVWHNIRAVTRVALYTIYAPPKH